MEEYDLVSALLPLLTGGLRRLPPTVQPRPRSVRRRARCSALACPKNMERIEETTDESGGKSPPWSFSAEDEGGRGEELQPFSTSAVPVIRRPTSVVARKSRTGGSRDYATRSLRKDSWSHTWALACVLGCGAPARLWVTSGAHNPSAGSSLREFRLLYGCPPSLLAVCMSDPTISVGKQRVASRRR